MVPATYVGPGSDAPQQHPRRIAYDRTFSPTPVPLPTLVKVAGNAGGSRNASRPARDTFGFDQGATDPLGTGTRPAAAALS